MATATGWHELREWLRHSPDGGEYLDAQVYGSHSLLTDAELLESFGIADTPMAQLALNREVDSALREE